MIRLYRY